MCHYWIILSVKFKCHKYTTIIIVLKGRLPRDEDDSKAKVDQIILGRSKQSVRPWSTKSF